MATLSLRISIVEKNVTKTMQFDPTTSVYDACRIIREKISEANQGQPKDYGLFLADEDVKKGVWLEPIRNLEYYILRNGDLLEYRKKLRTLRVRMLDGTLKTLLVDDSQPVANLMVVICTKIGITNHDEYSLVRENQEEELENKPNFGTLTLKRKKEEKERDAKMDQLRKKLKTDDEVNWIDPSKTLREQGIDENETLLLRRKFFFSDQNIDSRDPVQLNLLYVQARDAILDGTHPVTQEKACEFAGIQCHIQFGSYNEYKHRPGFLELKEFLPQSYAKVKGIEKKVFAEHKKHVGLSELDAKVQYTKTARSLKTYGVTFFLVKEKMKGKNKLVPRLLGVTKDSVLRLDEKTKEILKTWPLTTVRRWGASPNTFTLDFGDYSDQYYSVQTTEAEQILQLIAGYIDIILKKKKSKDHFGIEGDEGSTMVEDSVSPLKATILQHETSKIGKVNTESLAKPAIMRAGADGARPYGTGHMGGAQYTTISGQVNLAHAPPLVQQSRITSVLTEPQRALLSTISAGHDVIITAEKELETKAQIPELGSDPVSLKWKETTLDTNKQNVSSQIAAMNAATAQVVTLTSGSADEVDHTAVGAAITTITTNLPEMTRGVRMIAALMEDESSGEKLLDAARKLCSAFSDLLKAAEPETKEPRQNLLNAASRVGEASHQVLSTIGHEDESSRELQDILLGLAKAVANTTAALVLKAKNIAATCEDQATQNKVIGAATQCALATSQLVACAKVVAPTLHSPACQEQLMAAVREVARAVEGLVTICNESCPDEHLLRELSQAASEVTRTLNDLLNHIKLGTREKARESVQEGAVETILVATDRLFASTGDAAEMVRQARVLGQATAQLIQAIKGEAEKQPDSEIQRRLLAAAKTLADATARMVEAARLCASSPHDAQRQNQLRQAVEELRAATTAAATPALRKRLITRLEAAAKQAASTATQCIAAAQGAAHHNTNKASQEELMGDCKTMADHIPSLVEGVKGTLSNPENPAAQLNLINASEQFLQPGARVVQSARAVLPTVSDQASALQLTTSSQHLGTALGDLRSALNRAREVCSGLELDSASELIRSLQAELEAFHRAAERAELRPLPGETAESTALQLGSTSKHVGFAMAQLLSAAAQGNENYTGMAARNTSSALRDLTMAVRGVAATTNNRDVQTKIISSAEDVMERSLRLIEEARQALQTPESPSNAQNLTQVAKDVSQALNKCVGCLPGQKDVDEAIHSITDASQILDRGEFPHSNKSYGQLQQELNSAAANLNDASADVVSSVRSPTQLAASSRTFGSAFGDLLGVSMEMAGQTKDKEVQGQMVVSLKNVSMVSSKLLVTAKSVAADPSAPNAKNQLAAAARAVTDSINYLIDVCTSAAPGQKECDNAIRKIQSMRPLLDNPTEPHNDSTYFECLDTVMEKSKSLGDGMTGIANHAKKSEHEQFGEAVKSVSNSICGLVEAAAQAAYLVGVSEPSSVAGRPGLVDQAQFARAAQSIQTACQHLTNPATNQQQVLSAATVIAKHTSSLCNACRVASSKTTNPVAKRHFVQSAKDVANSTANLVKEIKALDQDYSEQNRQSCAAATKPLLDAVDSLCTFAGSPEFASQPAKISIGARAAQEPILSSGRAIIDGSCSMVRAAKSLAVSPRDPPTWQLLANHSKSVSDSIKKLVTSIRDKAPGQKECDSAIEKLSARIRDLDQTSLAAVSQSLPPRRDNTLQGFTDQMESSVNEILEKLEPVRAAAKFEAENIGHAVNQMVLYFEPLVAGAVGAASNMVHSKQQMVLLDQTKTVAECALQLVYATKEGGGNPKAINIHPDIDESVDATRDALQDVGKTLEHLATQAGVVTGILDSITRAMTRVTESSHRHSAYSETGELSFVDYQTRMVTAAKEVARIAQEMVAKSATDVGRLGALGADLSRQYGQLASDATGAAAATSNADVSTRIRSGVQELGRACLELVKAGGACQMAPQGDTFAQRDVADSARHVSEKVSQVLAALQAGSRGTQACINAASTVSGIIGDLDTTIMFATAGTLHAENEEESFANHRENILKTAKALVEDTKTLVAGAASSQEQLAVAAQNAVSTIVQLAEVVKFGAASLGSNNPEAQVMLINAVKDVASALGDLIQATKAASGKSINDPSMNHLKDSAKVMVTNVTSLLKTVKAVEDEHTRGTRALESTIEVIAQEIRALHSPEQKKSHATPEELVRCTKSITVATAKAVAAGNSCKQDDIIVAANMGRKAISDMLTICKGTSNSADSEELRTRTLHAGHDVAVQYRELLQTVLHILSRPGGAADAKQNLPPISRRIAQCVTELVTSAELLKGTDWVDPDDPTVIAENELLGAAASIDAAAKKLASLRPRRSVQEADENLNFDEMILEAAKSIAAANSALVKAASAAQRELIDQGKVSRRPLTSSDDGQWSEGLISAARLVAAATHSLVESANSLVQGMASEEKLISSAKQVASSTAQLLVACKVKADPDADSTKRLQAAGNAVKRATDNLVRAAQQSIQQEEERSLVLNRRMVGGIAQEINARSDVLRFERQLEEARGRLAAIRQAKYKMKGGDTSASDTEPDGYGSGYESFTTRYETRSYDNTSTPKHSGSTPVVHTTNMSPNGNVQNLSSPEKLLSSINKVERAYNDIQGMLDDAGDSTRKISANLKPTGRKVLTPEILTGGGQTYSAVTTNNYSESSVNNFASSGGDETTTLEQRMLKQHTSQRTMEKRTVTMTTHSQLKSYRLNES
ncbi:Talin-1 [Cryptotermes secundus]|uniref:Talin-1 n=1 Tax=Cryptotermes secundus TaxID=105785 RepID=A0A2J7RK34_9NEOP|nr:talin-1 isoform X1 [Cryptotermes secundus]XP_033611431.1 talin-1 isoform X1 [Cryptotermes secundus]PNF41180.1 Talin-1 [Cryptotermes secundus]PNF41181.1 Talin-1 [Cryptotermes secundus]